MNDDDLRKKLTFRSWHRGTKEMDIIMGRFADSMLGKYDHTKLLAYEELMKENDPDLYNWITGREALAEHCQNNTVLKDLITFHKMS